MPNYAIMRTSKLKTAGNISASISHTFRERETPNADPSRTHLNEHHGPQTADVLRARIAEMIPDKHRKNAVLCVEHFFGASPEWWADATAAQQRQFFDKAEAWLRQTYGAENVAYFGTQLDESTPHAVAYVVPLKDGALNAKAWLGGRDRLSGLQTSFAHAVEDLGLRRGIERSEAKHERVQRAYGMLARADDATERIAPKYVERIGLADRAALLVGRTPPVLESALERIHDEIQKSREFRRTELPRAEQRGYLRGVKDLPEREAALAAERERVDEMRERVREREGELRAREREFEKTRVQEFESHMRAIGAQIAARGQEYVGQIASITKSFALQITEDVGLIVHPIHDWLKALKERLETLHRDDDYAVIKYSREGSPEVRQARDADLERHRDRSRDRGVEIDNDLGLDFD